jgi:hypothetical protein
MEDLQQARILLAKFQALVALLRLAQEAREGKYMDAVLGLEKDLVAMDKRSRDISEALEAGEASKAEALAAIALETTLKMYVPLAQNAIVEFLPELGVTRDSA